MRTARAAALLGLALLSAGLTACIAVGDIAADRIDTFRPADYAWSTKVGTNTLEGHAYSDATTEKPGACAGDVRLIPDGAYMAARAPRDTSAYVAADDRHARGVTLLTRGVTSVEAAYLERKTHCGGDGRFSFERLPDGAYIVYATAADGRHMLYRRVRLSGGGVKEIEIRHTCERLPRRRMKDFIEVCGVAPLRSRPPPGDPNF